MLIYAHTLFSCMYRVSLLWCIEYSVCDFSIIKRQEVSTVGFLLRPHLCYLHYSRTTCTLCGVPVAVVLTFY